MGISGLAGENKIKQNYTFFCLHLIVVLVVFNSILVFFIIIFFYLQTNATLFKNYLD